MLRRRRLVWVHQLNGPTLEGILVHRSRDCYRIVKAKTIEEDSTTPLDGEVEIPRERVVFLQLLAPSA